METSSEKVGIVLFCFVHSVAESFLNTCVSYILTLVLKCYSTGPASANQLSGCVYCWLISILLSLTFDANQVCKYGTISNVQKLK